MVETLAGLGDAEGIGDEEDGKEDEDVEGGIRCTKKLKDPLMPSVEEVAEHRMTHLPYRNWCRHCVRGRGKHSPYQVSKGMPGLPEFHVDFCFLREEEPWKTIAIL